MARAAATATPRAVASVLGARGWVTVAMVVVARGWVAEVVAWGWVAQLPLVARGWAAVAKARVATVVAPIPGAPVYH